MAGPRIELFLTRHTDTAWREVIAPWLRRDLGRLQRSYVLVATRGQAFGMKQRCLMENTALLGVEFLTPGLARKKWLSAMTAKGPQDGVKPAMGRELLLFGLRIAIERRLAPLEPGDPSWGFWKSLQSDPERALEDFDDLLRSGFTAEHFPLPQLRDVFGELSMWVGELGYEFAIRQNELAALTPVPADAPRIGGRLLVHGLTAEAWNEFFNVAALARRFSDVTVVLPEPEFRGRKALDENWVELWQSLLGVSALPIDATSEVDSCDAVSALWDVGPANKTFTADISIEETRDSPTARARILVGETRGDEMHLVADEIAQLLAAGSNQIGVIFPQLCPGHLQLSRLLVERAIPFADLLEAAGSPPIEIQIERALLAFYERGARLEEFLELWPLLRATGHTELALRSARDVCERLFDEGQTHLLEGYLAQLEKSARNDWREVGRVAKLLLPAWPEEITLAGALERLAPVMKRFDISEPAGWPALTAFAQREIRVLPARVVFSLIGSFLPESVTATNLPGRGVFAPVILGARRRMEGLAFSDVILVHANAGVWPSRGEASPWLTDEQRTGLNEKSRFSLGLFTSEDRAWLEKRSYAALARDARSRVIFSAAVSSEELRESKLAPNSWLERLIWAKEAQNKSPGSFEDAWEQLAARYAPAPNDTGPFQTWLKVWRDRRDPVRPFDEFFLSVDPQIVRPDRLPARLIERAVQDPAELWFEEILGATRVNWTPLVRTRKKAIGQVAHRVLALTLREPSVEGNFGEKLPVEAARLKLRAELDQLRARWPKDRYWDSFRAELARICTVLLENVFTLSTGRYVGVELSLPRGASVPIDSQGNRLAVYGRVDLAFFDRTAWPGATLDIVDFKTGADAKLSAERMAREGSSLQLGVYLAAAQSLGVADGRVWMVKPEPGASIALELGELPSALVKLEQIGRHLASGRYGALTREPSEYAPDGFAWPLACAPVPWTTLEQKFAVTFGEFPMEEGDE